MLEAVFTLGANLSCECVCDSLLEPIRGCQGQGPIFVWVALINPPIGLFGSLDFLGAGVHCS